MTIVIIEDEKLTAKDLEKVILEVDPSFQVIAILHSVKQGIEYLSNNPNPDLIFSDIQLGDGQSFDIFEKVKLNVPIVFCTAYDKYMLNAFKANGIDYLLKPFTQESVKLAIEKYRNLSQLFSTNNNAIEEIKQALENMKIQKSSNILVYNKEKIIPIRIEDIAVFYIDNQATYLKSFEGKTYFLDKTLSQIEEVCGDNFYRANRQVLINRRAIKDASHHLSRKFFISLTIPFDQTITVSKEKLREFLDWLAQ